MAKSQAAERLRLGNMQKGWVSASERRLFIACTGPNLFVAMSLHHNHAITVMRIADRFLDEGDEEDEEDEEDESGNAADRTVY